MLTKTIKDLIEAWQNPPFDEESRDEISALVKKGDETELYERFHTRLSFGTGGLRGIMGAGINRMNHYTLAAVTQGLVDYLIENVENIHETGVVIGYDSRNNSQQFAELTATIVAQSGIRSYLFSQAYPVPLLASSIRLLEASAGVMITASHNPPKYNGYKVFWADASQVIAPHDQGIIDKINRIQVGSKALPRVDLALKRDTIRIVPEEIIEKYYQLVLDCQTRPGEFSESRSQLKIVYSPLHGTGYRPINEVFSRAGFSKLSVVAEQRDPDGNFPTLTRPNPEEPAAMRMAIELANQLDAEIVMATDPDSDRVGLGVRDENGKIVLLDGNQTGAILAWHVLNTKPETRPKKISAIISTVVSSNLVKRMAKHYQARYFSTLTGFKNIGSVMRRIAQEMPELEFVFGYEESFGYLFKDYLRDKDGVVTCLLIAEAAALTKSKGLGLWQILIEIWRTHGVFREKLFSFEEEGVSGAKRIERIMSLFRSPASQALFSRLGGIELLDIQEQGVLDLASGDRTPNSDYPISNVLVVSLPEDGKIAVRPSGTEPKIKFYVSLTQNVSPETSDQEILAVYRKLGDEIDQLFAKLDKVMQEA